MNRAIVVTTTEWRKSQILSARVLRIFGSSVFLMGLSNLGAWFQVESSAEEEDSGSVIGEVSESAG
ncbi:MAG: hypothetical protein LBR07_06190, partial [Puniceicoccales bacterium]|nr:hypothetical protein [Puniceicoccales bacterium]